MSAPRTAMPHHNAMQTTGQTKRRWHLTAWATVLLPPLMAPLAAHATVELALKLDTHFGHNSNLFRVDQQAPGTSAPASATTAVLPTAFQSQTAEVGVGVPLGSEQTRLILTASLSKVAYSAQHGLNNRPRQATLALPWRLTDLWAGELSAGQAHEAYAFDDVYPKLDTVKRSWSQAAIKLQVTPDISFPVQFAQQSLSHGDKATHAVLDSEQKRVSSGVLYQSPTGSSAQWGVARAEVRYPGRAGLASGAQPQEDDTDVFVDVNWFYSPKTQLALRWANRQRTFSQTGTTARMDLYRLGATHVFSPMLRVDAQYWQQPVATTDTGFPSATSTGQRIGLSYTLHEKWVVDMSWLKDSQQDQALTATTGATPLNPTTSTYTVRAQYQVAPSLSVYLGAAAEKRTRRQTETASQNVVRLGLEYRFENLPGAGLRTRPAAAPGF